MGSRKISLEPAASCLGCDGLMAMNVSLCGPHSLETSTLVAVDDDAAVTSGSAPLLRMNWYLSHQVGSFATGAASAALEKAAASTIGISFMLSPLGNVSPKAYTSGAWSFQPRRIGVDSAATQEPNWRPVSGGLPCPSRPTCRGWRREGVACHRAPARGALRHGQGRAARCAARSALRRHLRRRARGAARAEPAQ